MWRQMVAVAVATALIAAVAVVALLIVFAPAAH